MNQSMHRLPTIARYLMGLIFFVFGLNGFLHFLPAPPPSGAAGDLAMAFVNSGYLMAFVKGTEVAVGLALLTNRFAPLALVVAAPVTLNIIAFHAFLAPQGMVLPIVLLVLHLGAAWAYRDLYKPLLAAKTEPAEVTSVRRVHVAA